MSEEIVLDSAQWRVEAEQQIKDIRNHVRFVEISERVESSETGVHINLTTLEEIEVCVLLSAQGFRVVGDLHDSTSGSSRFGERSYETPYALLTSISPGYQNSVGEELMRSLAKLSDEQ